MARVVMYSTVVCPYCQMAERLLKQRGVETIEKILIDRDADCGDQQPRSAQGLGQGLHRGRSRQPSRAASHQR